MVACSLQWGWAVHTHGAQWSNSCFRPRKRLQWKVPIILRVLCLRKVIEFAYVPLGFLFFPPFFPPALFSHPPCEAALLALL